MGRKIIFVKDMEIAATIYRSEFLGLESIQKSVDIFSDRWSERTNGVKPPQ